MKTKLALGLLLLVGACGDDKRPGVAPAGSGGTASGGTGGASAGSSGSSNGGMGDAGEGSTAPGAPVVTVTSPDAVDHPNNGEVLVDDEVHVLCRATKSPEADSQPVNPSSVQIEALDAGGMSVAQAAGAPTSNANEYSADLIIASVPNGVVSFRCSASDTSDAVLTGSDTISTFVDHGPAINVKSPLPDSAHALIGSLRVEFTVDPAPLADGDDGAAISEVELEVNGITIDTMNEGDNLYTADINLNDDVVFPTTPKDDVPVVIRAKNVRSPVPAERFEAYSFKIDSVGPTIAITSHVNEDVIGGQETLVFTVIDELSPIDEQTVVVEINQVEHRYDPTDANWTIGDDGKFSYRIDSRPVHSSVAQLTINISASDTAGNSSEGESLTLFLDNQPPIVDLDPGNVREIKREPPNVFCSESYDPLGDGIHPDTGMPNDGAVITNMILPRALVWEMTNGAPGQDYFYEAGTDEQNVYLYMQHDTNVPLLKDTDSDGDCDDIDRDLELPFIRLNPIPPKGEAYFTKADGDAPSPNGACSFKIADADPAPLRPNQLCKFETSDMNRVIQHGLDGEPVVYGKGSITDLECTGGEWELTQFIPMGQEGWICLAVVALDKKGNRGVSVPIRLCYDDGLTAEQPACVSDQSNPPSCMPATCTPPPSFDGGVYEFR